MPAYGQIATEVAAYVDRDPISFIKGDVDLLCRAINKARRWAEKKHNFELCRTSATIPDVDYQNGASIVTAVLVGTTERVSVKVIERAYLEFSNGVGTFPIQVLSRSKHQQRLARRYENMLNREKPTVQPTITAITLHQQGPMVYLAPADPVALGLAGSEGRTVDVHLDVVRWLPEYTLPEQHDFFTDYCEDFLLYRSILELNLYLKEDQRMQVGAAVLNDAWQAVLDWDQAIVKGASEDMDLD